MCCPLFLYHRDRSGQCLMSDKRRECGPIGGRWCRNDNSYLRSPGCVCDVWWREGDGRVLHIPSIQDVLSSLSGRCVGRYILNRGASTFISGDTERFL